MQARTQLLAISEVLPRIKEVKVFDQQKDASVTYANEMGTKLDINIRPVETIEEAVIQRPVIGITSLGSSVLNYLFWLKPALEDRGYEVAVFHAMGMGGRALEHLIADGTISAALDLCLQELIDHMLGSPVSSGEERLEMAGKKGIPQIVAPGSISALDFAPFVK